MKQNFKVRQISLKSERWKNIKKHPRDVSSSFFFECQVLGMRGEHRCTRVKNAGEGVPDVFAKIPRGGGGPPISGFIAFLLTSVLKFAWGGYYINPPPSPPRHPPVCIYGGGGESVPIPILFHPNIIFTWPGITHPIKNLGN